MFSAHTLAFKDQCLYVGLTNGKIYMYKKKNMDAKLIVDRGKETEVIEMASPTPHKGRITQLIYTEIDGREVLISGSADRTIKLWEPKNNKGNKCFQTIIGHQGSILGLVYLPMIQVLVSSSTDKSMKVWRIDQAR
jgi:WD40 repeat protein